MCPPKNSWPPDATSACPLSRILEIGSGHAQVRPDGDAREAGVDDDRVVRENANVEDQVRGHRRLPRAGRARKRGLLLAKERRQTTGQKRLAIGGIGDRCGAREAVAAVRPYAELEVRVRRAPQPVGNLEQRATDRDRQRP